MKRTIALFWGIWLRIHIGSSFKFWRDPVVYRDFWTDADPKHDAQAAVKISFSDPDDFTVDPEMTWSLYAVPDPDPSSNSNN